MRKFLLGVAGAAALAIGSTAAQAATVVDSDGIDSTILNATGTESFDATLTGGGSFNLEFSFVLDAASLANGQVSSIMLGGNDIDFSSVLIDTFAFTQSSFDPSTETWELVLPASLSAGSHTLFVNGDLVGLSGNGSFGGNINIAAIPEPAVWAMMIIGFAGIGSAMRRRNIKPAVSFA